MPQAQMDRLENLLYELSIEQLKRLTNRFSPFSPLTLNPRFSILSATTTTSSAPTMTLSGLTARQKNDQARAPLSPKTNLKKEAQERLFVDVFGANTQVSSLNRDKARELVEILVRLPAKLDQAFSSNAGPGCRQAR